jgi:hypothetical protein
MIHSLWTLLIEAFGHAANGFTVPDAYSIHDLRVYVE